MLSFDENKSLSPLNLSTLHASELASREVSIQDKMVQQIATRCKLHVPEGESSEEATLAVQELFKGKAAKYEKWRYGSSRPVLPLPLQPEDEMLFKSLFQSCPIVNAQWSVMDFLGFHTFRALKFLMEKEQITCAFIENFCRDWLIIYFSDEDLRFLKISMNYTNVQMVQHMQTTLQELETIIKRKNKKKYRLQYENAVNSIGMLIKILQTKTLGKDFLLKLAGNISCLDCYVKIESENSQENYAEMILFIEFMCCAYSNTQDLVKKGQRDECMTALLTIQQMSRSLEKEQCRVHKPKEQDEGDLIAVEKHKFHLHSLTKMQKHMLAVFRSALQSNAEKNQQLIDFQKKAEWGAVSANKVNQTQGQLLACYYRQHRSVHALQLSIDMFDNFFLQVNNAHVTLKSRMIRLNAYKNRVLSYVLQAEDFKTRRDYISDQDQTQLRQFTSEKDSEQTTLSPDISRFMEHMIHLSEEIEVRMRPLQEGLSEISKKAVFECFASLINEFEEAFLASDELMHYARRTLQEPENRFLISLLPIDNNLYKMMHDFFEILCSRFDPLQKKYSQMFIKLLDTIPAQTCQKYKNEILEVIDDLLLAHLTPGCMTYLLYQDLYLLTQEEGTKAPCSLLETSIGRFLLNEEFEYAFMQKSALAQAKKEEAVAVEKPSLVKTLERAPAPSKLMPKPKSIKVQPSRVSSSSSSSFPSSSPSQLSEWSVRRGEKVRKTLKNLKALGLHAIRQSGSHLILRNAAGKGCTVSIHGEGLTNTVRRGIERQVTEIKNNALKTK